MIDSRDRAPRRGAMAGFTTHAGRNVRGILSGRSCAFMTARAIGRNARVRECCGSPSSRRMAGIASGRGGDVSHSFACCKRTVVAGGAGAKDLSVIHFHHRRPAAWRVT